MTKNTLNKIKMILHYVKPTCYYNVIGHIQMSSYSENNLKRKILE